jgi:hypothetical protein
MRIAPVAGVVQACTLIDPIAFSGKLDESVWYSQTSNFVCCCSGNGGLSMETVLDRLFFE